MNLVEKAKEFATEAHGDQLYGGDKPYVYHLAKVVGVLQRFGVESETLLAAAWLHDTVEDTKVKLWQLDDEFGLMVVDLVWAVTNESGKNRAERHAKTYTKISAVGVDAVLLKLADRIANVEQCAAEQRLTGESKLLQMYQKEHGGFLTALRKDRNDTEVRMWQWLEQLLAPVAI